MPVYLLVLTLVFALADWLAVEKFWRRVHFVAKPGTLLSLIAWFTLAVGWEGPNLWFGLGLVFSLLGDINLLLPGRFFMPGLVSFLLAHVAYIIGFNQGAFPLHPLVIVYLAAILGYDTWLIRLLIFSPTGRRMAAPVTIYTAAISLMFFSALSCLMRPEWSQIGAVMVSFGAALFLMSDSVLAYNRFIARTPHNDLVVMVTYHLAQIALVAGLILQ